jgi:hypothetical protein
VHFVYYQEEGVMVTLQSVISARLLVILVAGAQTFPNFHVDISNNG